MTHILHMEKVVDLAPTDIVHVKFASDSTVLSHLLSACVTTVHTITNKGDEIGVVGVVSGGDSWEDMMLCAKPYLDQLHEFAKNPQITTEKGTYQIIVHVGGDMCHLLSAYGQMQASSGYPCFVCVLPKSDFYLTLFHPGNPVTI